MVLFDFLLTTVVLKNIIELTMASSDLKIVNEIPKSIPTSVEPSTDLNASALDIHMNEGSFENLKNLNLTNNTLPINSLLQKRSVQENDLSQYPVSDISRKIELCRHVGTVKSLKAYKKPTRGSSLPESHCEDVSYDEESDIVPLGRLEISGFSNKWYKLDSSNNIGSKLDLHGNKIVVVQSELLNNLPKHIEAVDLAENEINGLLKGMIDNVHLQTLNLSSNVIWEIEESALEKTTLSVLDLSHNRITNTTFIATLPYNLTILLLKDNQIRDMPGQSFSRLNKLTILDLAGNNITVLENSSRLQLPSLRELDLGRNNLITIEPGFFQYLEGLEELFLEQNNLITLDKDVFRGLEVINYINLDRNNLSTISNGFLHGLPNTLYGLGLCCNQIKTLESGTFSAVPKGVLFLHDNNITTIEKGSFNLPNLRVLSLKNNSLRHLDSESFVGLENLQYLALHNNGIKNISDDFLKHLRNIIKVAFSQNPIKELGNDPRFV